MIKVVITTVPFIDYATPLAAPAYLKSILADNGIDCVGLDLNIEIYNIIRHDPNKELYLDFFYRQKINPQIVDKLDLMLHHYAKRLLDYNPSHIGLSLFSINSQVFTVWLCVLLRKIAPHVKILLGGPGLETLTSKVVSFPETLKKKNLIDDYIVGDATKSIVGYFKSKSSEGINDNNWQQDPDFAKISNPNFDDYDFMLYDDLSLPIVDSRGCVQNCEFCDVIAFWKKFQYVEAESIFATMLHLIDRYNVYKFQFASSICNGNLIQFKKLVKMIAQHNEKASANNEIFWNGSFIIRSKGKHSDELWQDIKKSNGYLYCGVESLASEVRIRLGKNFDNNDLDDHLQMARKYNVPINLLIIAAYHGETKQDYENAIKWFEDHRDYANNTIYQVQMTSLALLEGTALNNNIDKDAFIKDNPKRLDQFNKLKDKAIQCGFTVIAFH